MKLLRDVLGTVIVVGLLGFLLVLGGIAETVRRIHGKDDHPYFWDERHD